MKNRQVIVAQRPVGVPRPEHFEIISTRMSTIDEGEVLVRNEFLSVDPAMRGWLNESANYTQPVPVGSVMRANAAGTVVESRSNRYPVGTRVMGQFGWQEFATVVESDIVRVVADKDLPISLSLGVLGPNGITAWFGIKDVLRPREGDTVVVSTAAGSVGSAAGQIAAASGCRTVGIAGGSAKRDICTTVFGYDAAVDYKSPSFEEDLNTACPDGVDAYFDNTGGSISDAVLRLLRVRGSVLICGTAAIPNGPEVPMGPRVERILLTRRARMQGILVWDYRSRFLEAIEGLSGMIRSGRLTYREDILDGLETAPSAIEGLYAGANLGKLLIRLAD